MGSPWDNLNIKEANSVWGFFNPKTDICKKKEDGKCPCYPEDDDWYCPDEWHLWTKLDDDPSIDKEFGKCDLSKIPRNGPKGTFLCPMRKPLLNRWYDPKTQRDPYYYVDYDCIQCVPNEENCSKCSPGIYCPPLGRCVGPRLVQWCKKP